MLYLLVFLMGFTMHYLYSRMTRSMWVELGRVQTMINRGAKIIVSDKNILKLKEGGITTHTYCEDSSKFLIKQLKKGGYL